MQCFRKCAKQLQQELYHNIRIKIYPLYQFNASRYVWLPHLITSIVHTRYRKGFLERVGLLYQVSESGHCGCWAGFSLEEVLNYSEGLLKVCLTELCLWFICSYVSSGYLPVTAVEKQFQRHFVSLSHWLSADQVTSLHNATNLRYTSSSWLNGRKPGCFCNDKKRVINRKRTTNSLRLLPIFSGMQYFIN